MLLGQQDLVKVISEPIESFSRPGDDLGTQAALTRAAVYSANDCYDTMALMHSGRIPRSKFDPCHTGTLALVSPFYLAQGPLNRYPALPCIESVEG